MGNHKIHEEVILEGRKLTKVFGTGKKAVTAVNGVDFAFHKGEIISIVGESGSGKTTLMNMLMGLSTPTSGEIWFRGKRLQFHKGAERKSYWKSVQAIFQDPFSSFNQFFRIERIFMDGLSFSGRHVTGKEAQFQIAEACRFVNLEYASLEGKYPFELSGGQMQRLMMARLFSESLPFFWIAILKISLIFIPLQTKSLRDERRSVYDQHPPVTAVEHCGGGALRYRSS